MPRSSGQGQGHRSKKTYLRILFTGDSALDWRV